MPVQVLHLFFLLFLGSSRYILRMTDPDEVSYPIGDKNTDGDRWRTIYK